jgi:hypothetical protein
MPLPSLTPQVCAPSNSALDEIVLRLISAGLTDQDGRVFTPNVVRVGVSIHHSVQSVALDTLVAQRLGGDAGKVGLGEGFIKKRKKEMCSVAEGAWAYAGCQGCCPTPCMFVVHGSVGNVCRPATSPS